MIDVLVFIVFIVSFTGGWLANAGNDHIRNKRRQERIRLAREQYRREQRNLQREAWHIERHSMSHYDK